MHSQELKWDRANAPHNQPMFITNQNFSQMLDHHRKHKPDESLFYCDIHSWYADEKNWDITVVNDQFNHDCDEMPEQLAFMRIADNHYIRLPDWFVHILIASGTKAGISRAQAHYLMYTDPR